jgi:hypothetical protein
VRRSERAESPHILAQGRRVSIAKEHRGERGTLAGYLGRLLTSHPLFERPIGSITGSVAKWFHWKMCSFAPDRE